MNDLKRSLMDQTPPFGGIFRMKKKKKKICAEAD